MINIFDINKDVYFFLDLENKASGLSVMAQRYRKDAEHLNLRSTYAKIAAGAVVSLVFILYFFVF